MTNRKKLHRISSGFISDDEIFSKPSRKNDFGALGGIHFEAKYIGCIEILFPRTKSEIVAAMRRVRYEFKSRGFKKRSVDICISLECIKVILMRKGKKRIMTWDENKFVVTLHPLYRIYCTAIDWIDWKIFSYVAKDGASNTFKCYVFKCQNKNEALKIVRRIGDAFEFSHRIGTEESNLENVQLSERKGIQNASLYNQKMIHSKGIEERKRMSYSAEHDGSISDILRKQNIYFPRKLSDVCQDSHSIDKLAASHPEMIEQDALKNNDYNEPNTSEVKINENEAYQQKEIHVPKDTKNHETVNNSFIIIQKSNDVPPNIAEKIRSSSDLLLVLQSLNGPLACNYLQLIQSDPPVSDGNITERNIAQCQLNLLRDQVRSLDTSRLETQLKDAEILTNLKNHKSSAPEYARNSPSRQRQNSGQNLADWNRINVKKLERTSRNFRRFGVNSLDEVEFNNEQLSTALDVISYNSGSEPPYLEDVKTDKDEIKRRLNNAIPTNSQQSNRLIDNSSFRRPIFENPLRSYVQKSPSLFQQIAHRNFSNQINKPYDMDKKNWISDADNCNNEQNSDATKNHHASERNSLLYNEQTNKPINYIELESKQQNNFIELDKNYQISNSSPDQHERNQTMKVLI